VAEHTLGGGAESSGYDRSNSMIGRTSIFARSL
jgi:hypothetical protein